MLGGQSQGRNDIELTGLMIWGHPWETSGWEVTERFFEKWGFLFKGCREILIATNHWRELRGDEPLIWEL